MKKVILFSLPLFALGGLLGCRVPSVDYHVGLHQKKIQALQHWDLMAKEVVDKVTADSRFAGKAIAVKASANPTVFANTFHQMIKTELLNRKALNVDGDANAPTLEVDTQLVRHRGRNWFAVNPGSPIALAIILPIQVITGGVFGDFNEASSEIMVVSLARDGGVPQMAVKQIAYVEYAEAAAFYLRPAKPGSDEFAAPIKVTTVP